MSIKPDGSHIEHREVGGQHPVAYIAGTRITVRDVFVLSEQEGRSPKSIVAAYPSLTLADVHAALAYYWDHQDEIDLERSTMQRGEQSGNGLNCLDLAEQSGFVGSAPDAPGDLSTNPKYMEGFGRG